MSTPSYDFWVQSLFDGEITEANEAFYYALDYPLSFPLTWAILLPNHLHLFQQGITHLRPASPTFECINALQTKNGQILYVEWLHKGIFDTQGNLQSIESLGRNVTREKQLEKRLLIRQRNFQKLLRKYAQQKRLFQLISTTIHSGLDINSTLQTILDKTRETLACDRVAVYQFDPDWRGYCLAESVAEGCSPVVTHPFNTCSEQQEEGQKFRSGQVIVCHDIYRSSWSNCYLEFLERLHARALIIAPIFVEQHLWGLFTVYQCNTTRVWKAWEIDVCKRVGIHVGIALYQSELIQTLQNQVAELQRLDRLKDEFLSTVSHELRSPLHTMGLAIKLLELKLKKQGVLAQDTLDITSSLETLKNATRRETELVNDLLDFTQLRAGQFELRWESLPVRTILEPIITNMALDLESHEQHLHINWLEQDLVVVTHRLSLERIVQELLTNAYKYTPRGESIYLSVESGGKNQWVLRVCNTGVEIPLAEQEQVFAPFYRLQTLDVWNCGGTGLGLALVKRLVETLGGTIQLVSANRQTEFIVTLPITPL